MKQNNTYRNIFMWGMTLFITGIISFFILEKMQWGEPWHQNAVDIVIAAICFGITRRIYDRYISPSVLKKINSNKSS